MVKYPLLSFPGFAVIFGQNLPRQRTQISEEVYVQEHFWRLVVFDWVRRGVLTLALHRCLLLQPPLLRHKIIKLMHLFRLLVLIEPGILFKTLLKQNTNHIVNFFVLHIGFFKERPDV